LTASQCLSSILPDGGHLCFHWPGPAPPIHLAIPSTYLFYKINRSTSAAKSFFQVWSLIAANMSFNIQPLIAANSSFTGRFSKSRCEEPKPTSPCLQLAACKYYVQVRCSWKELWYSLHESLCIFVGAQRS
jgi:hypothetical protein